MKRIISVRWTIFRISEAVLQNKMRCRGPPPPVALACP